MTGKVVLITGANSGIGRAMALGVAREGARVVMVCRNEKRGRKARKSIITESGNDQVDLMLADLSSRPSIRKLCSEFNASYDRLDVLVNNAGIMTGRRRTTAEGFEMQFFVNHIAYFMVTQLLFEKLRATAPSRIVNVASTAHSSGTLNFDDLQGEVAYKGHKAYANSKLANIVFTYELARRIRGTGVTANCVHPGVIHTNLLKNFNFFLNGLFHMLQRFFKQPEEGADTPLYLISSEEVAQTSGKYFKYRAVLGSSDESNDPQVQKRLWQVSEEIAGLSLIPDQDLLSP